MKPTKALIEAIAVTAELTQTQLSSAAARVMAEDLARYPEPQVLAALVRCRRELKGRLTIADVLTRLEDGRPGAEEAWAMIPKDEGASVCWTPEMTAAWAVAAPLLAAGDEVAARMAFKEAYTRHLQRVRDAGEPVRWTMSLGYDKAGREQAIRDAVEKGRITSTQAVALLPHVPDVLPAPVRKLLDTANLVRGDA